MKIMNNTDTEYFIVKGLPPGSYEILAGNSAGESTPVVYNVPAPPVVIPAQPVVLD